MTDDQILPLLKIQNKILPPLFIIALSCFKMCSSCCHSGYVVYLWICSMSEKLNCALNVGNLCMIWLCQGKTNKTLHVRISKSPSLSSYISQPRTLMVFVLLFSGASCIGFNGVTLPTVRQPYNSELHVPVKMWAIGNDRIECSPHSHAAGGAHVHLVGECEPTNLRQSGQKC